MTVGMFIATAAFLVSFFVQLKIESGLPKYIPSGQSQLNVVSLSNGCNLEATSGAAKLVTSRPFEASVAAFFPAGSAVSFNLVMKCKTGKVQTAASLALVSQESFGLYAWREGSALQYKLVKNNRKKQKKGLSYLRAIYRANIYGLNLTSSWHSYILNGNASGGLVVTPYLTINPAHFSVTLRKEGQNSSYSLGQLTVKSGASMTLLPHVKENGVWSFNSVVEVQSNTVHLLLQIPQYVLITCAEILVSITGLSYSYTQAPESMKSTVSALWLITVGLGNVLVALVAEIVRTAKMSMLMIVFVILAFVTGVLFAVDAYCYVPNYQKPREEVTHEPVKDD